MSQMQSSGRGLLPSPTAWSAGQHPAAMLADVTRYKLGRTGVNSRFVFTLYLLFCVSAFPGSNPVCDLKIGTPVATLPGVWHYRVSAGTGWSGVSIL